MATHLHVVSLGNLVSDAWLRRALARAKRLPSPLRDAIMRSRINIFVTHHVFHKFASMHLWNILTCGDGNQPLHD